MKNQKLLYFSSTALIVLAVGFGSLGDFLQLDPIKESTLAIGFPLYVLPLFGILKVLGTLAITLPALSRFREVAYAGLIYYFIGATYCHLAVGEGIEKYGVTLLILAIVVISYWTAPIPVRAAPQNQLS